MEQLTLAELNEKCRDAETRMVDVVAELRRTAAAQAGPPRVEAAVEIVAYISGERGELMYGPGYLGKNLGMTADEVCDVVAQLGTFLGQSQRTSAGKATKGKTFEAVATAQEIAERKTADLANLSGTPAERTGNGAKKRSRTTTKPSSDQLSIFPMHSGDTIALPSGWERTYTKRELDRAVANIVANKPDEDTIRRWMLRKWGNAAVSVTYELLASMWMFARLGRITEIGEIAEMGEGNPSLARALADGWDMLSESRRDAVAAVARIVTENLDAEQIHAEIARCRWVAEAELSRVEDAAERCIANDVARDAVLDARIEDLAAAIAEDPERVCPKWVYQLNSGQLRRLGESFGLDPDGDGALRRQVSEMVTEAGLGADADRIVSLGVAALRAGFDDQFRDALEMRAAGELGWAEELHTALNVAP